MEIFKLFGSIFVDNEKANESISKTDKKGQSLAQTFGKGIKTVGAWGAAVAGAAVAGGAALAGMAMKSAETADRVDKLSNKIGISKEAFQEWDYVMAQNGMDVEKLQVGVKTLTSKMDAATKGNKDATATFKKLGLSVTDATGKLKSQEQMTNEAIMALAGMENGTEKARLATELFGKAGQEMMPMLNNGAEGITQLKDRAHELGLVMSDEAVGAGVLLGDTMDDVKKSFGAIVTKIGVEVMPIVQSLLEWVLANMPQIQAVCTVVFDTISQAISILGTWITQAITWFQSLSTSATGEGNKINQIWQDVQTKFQERFQAIINFIQAFVGMCKRFWDEWGEYITTAFGAAFAIVEGLFGTFTDAITDLLNIWAAIMNGDISGMCEGIKKLYSNLFKNIGEMFKNWAEKAKQALGILLDKLVSIVTNIGTSMFNAGKSIITSLWNGAKEVWNNVVKWVNEKINWLADQLTFWDNGKKKMSEDEGSNAKNTRSTPNGSHANGLSYVPFNGYRAELHEGERVLTKEENKAYNNKSNTIQINIVNPQIRDDDDLRYIEESTYKALNTYNRALGVV